jgi:hypothetical protein
MKLFSLFLIVFVLMPQAFFGLEPAYKISDITIPTPDSEFIEIFLKHRSNPRFQTINFDNSLQLFFVPKGSEESFVFDNLAIPMCGLKVNYHGTTDEKNFYENCKLIEDSLFNISDLSVEPFDVCLGRVCEVKNIFPLKVFERSNRSYGFISVFEYSVLQQEKIVDKNYYFGSLMFVINKKLFTLSFFIDMRLELHTSAVCNALTEWEKKIRLVN